MYICVCTYDEEMISSLYLNTLMVPAAAPPQSISITAGQNYNYWLLFFAASILYVQYPGAYFTYEEDMMTSLLDSSTLLMFLGLG